MASVTLAAADARAIARYLTRVVPYGITDADELLRLLAILTEPMNKGDQS